MSAIPLLCFVFGLLPLSSGFTASHTGRIWSPSEKISKFPQHCQLTGTKTRLPGGKEEEYSKEPDLFEYFDPLLSPHAYPNGIEAEKEKVEGNTNGDAATTKEKANAPPPPHEQSANSDDVDYDPFQWSQDFSTKAGTKSKFTNPFGINLPSTTSNEEERPAVDTSTTFDPTLSPHAYANGAPDVIVGDADSQYIQQEGDKSSSTTIGVLLIDHGSKSEKSNQRLEDLAALYQQSMDQPVSNSNTNIIVQACHMEIASPTIQDGISSLVDAGAHEIICHPYFLSPGRHVTQDIPQLVRESIDALSVEIPVRTTDPLGSKTDVMLRAIHSLVEETSELFNK